MKADVLLIHPPANIHLSKQPAISPLIVGYGMLHVAACLIQKGYSVTVWNLEEDFNSGISQLDIEKGLRMLDPSSVGIELNWVNFSRGAIQTAEIIKKVNPDLPIIVGGTHATLFSRDIVLGYSHVIDAVLMGEAEKTFPMVVENLEKSGSMGEVGGLVTLRDGRLHEVPLSESDLYVDIDHIPPYSYRIIKHVRSDVSKSFPDAPVAVNTCRGPCKFSCVYCIGRHIAPLSGRSSFSIHSPEWIIDQMYRLMEEGAISFVFHDYFFSAGKKRVMNIAKALREVGICENVLGINITAIPGILDGETLEELSSAGVYNIDYGAESGSDRILNLLNRPTSSEKMLDAVKATISKGIIPYTWWMTGLPDERLEDVKETLNLMNKTTDLGAIPRWVTPLAVYPGTELFKRIEDFGIKLRLKSFEDFSVFSDLEGKAASWYPEAVSHETEHLNRYDIERAAFKMRLEIYRKKERIIEDFMDKYAKNVTSRHPQINMKFLEFHLKRDIDSLLTSFL